MERLTLHDAQARVAAIAGQAGIDADKLDWAAPIDEALRCMSYSGHAGPIAGPTAVRIGYALLAYAAHLSFEAGRDFELAAVTKACCAALDEAPDFARKDALNAFGVLLNDGLHHAEPSEAA
jgi:hypothetical protein